MTEKIPVTFDTGEKVEVPIQHTARLLENPGVESARATLHQELSDLEVKNCELIKLADENLANDNTVVEVNGNLIFKFPRREADMAKREEKFLNLLEGKVMVKIPKVLYSGEKTSFYGTDKMKGVHVDDAFFEHASEAQKDTLAGDVAQFLHELHTHMPIEEADRIGIKEDEADRKLSLSQLHTIIELQRGDDAGFKEFLSRAIEAYHGINTRSGEKKVFLHHDLSDGNLFLDPRTKRLEGVIDFGNVATGDKYIDFASLYRNRPEFALRVADKYGEVSGEAIDTERIRATAIVKEIAHLVQIPQKREKALNKLRKWYEEAKS